MRHTTKTRRLYIRDGRAPIPKNELISRVMSAIRSKNTKPELLVRKMLSSAGIRGYHLHPRRILGRPDIVFPTKRVAIFVHGCFWHGCPYCKLKLPKTNRAFWRKKISVNKLRDARKAKELRKSGWRLITAWACRLKTERGKSLILLRICTAIE